MCNFVSIIVKKYFFTDCVFIVKIFYKSVTKIVNNIAIMSSCDFGGLLWNILQVSTERLQEK